MIVQSPVAALRAETAIRWFVHREDHPTVREVLCMGELVGPERELRMAGFAEVEPSARRRAARNCLQRAWFLVDDELPVEGHLVLTASIMPGIPSIAVEDESDAEWDRWHLRRAGLGFALCALQGHDDWADEWARTILDPNGL